MLDAARTLTDLGFSLIATRGTQTWLAGHGVPCVVVNKAYEGRPNIVDLMKDGAVQVVMNTTDGAQAVDDSRDIRSVALYDKIPYFTTAAGAHAAALAIRAQAEGDVVVKPLQS
jgi:carbamoyl-phosphate synthase large subunit